MIKPFSYQGKTYFGDFVAGNRIRFDATLKSAVQTDGSLDVLGRLVSLSAQEFIWIDRESYQILSAETRRDRTGVRYHLVKSRERNY